jgi:hypothetical protein
LSARTDRGGQLRRRLSVTNRRQQQTFTHDVIRRLVEIEAKG